MTYDQADEKIKQLADNQFLAKLVEIAKCYGWRGGDYEEIATFVDGLHEIAGKDRPIASIYLEPHQLTE